MRIIRAFTRPSATPNPAWFTGRVRMDPLDASPPEPTRVRAALVTFEPGARTHWHTHPLGQHLYVVSGLGWAGAEGAEPQAIRPGDVVFFPPGLRHWHGASAATAMSHVAIQEALDGKTSDWMEAVADADYRGPAA